MVKNLRRLLWPLSLLFGVIVHIRRWFYDAFGLRFEAEIPVIVVGNLTTGGTGKTPHAAMITEVLLQHGKRPAWLSRGYGRKTAGFREVLYSSFASEVGDEPLMVKQRFPEIPVFVCENRREGIRRILELHPETEAIVLDDAFQHLGIKPRKAIALITYESLKEPWLLLPAGNARESLKALRLADLVMVTKCPSETSREEESMLRARIKNYFNGPVYFSRYRYTEFLHASGNKPSGEEVHLLTGIADPEVLHQFLSAQFSRVHNHFFPDHHPFTKDELRRVFQAAGDSPVMTTEKDRTRMVEAWPEISSMPNFFILPVVPDLGQSKREFEKWLVTSLFSEGKK